MARKGAATASEEVIERETPSRGRNYDESPLDARLLDLDDEAESPFLRAQKRISVRRGALPRKAAGRLKITLILLATAGCLAFVAFTLHRYATHSWRFRIDSSDNIIIVGARNVSRAQLMEVMGGDIDRNIFFVPLDARKKQFEQIPWIKSASVLRLLPNRLKVVIGERVPVAFVEINSHIQLIDANGVLLEPPANQAGYSFPVIVGMTDADPLSTRAARMKIYMQLVQELDSGGAHYSRDLSDMDLSDPDDVKATVTDPRGAVLVHLGSSNFLERFKVYVAHVQEWRTQFPKLQSVDLRYEHQVIINPDALPADKESTPAAEAQADTPAKTAAAQPRKKHK